MSTACWGDNKTFDCAQVYFGYGSRYDMIFSPGYWICLETLKMLVKYDYPQGIEHSSHAHLSQYKPEDLLLADFLGLEWEEDQHWLGLTEEQAKRLPLKYQMGKSSMHIKHPDGEEKSLDWWQQAVECSGYYYKNGYTELEPADEQYHGCRSRDSISRFPTKRAIERMFPQDWVIFQNIEVREDLARHSLGFYNKKDRAGFTTEEDIRAMCEEWEKERIEDEKRQIEENKRIWKQL